MKQEYAVSGRLAADSVNQGREALRSRSGFPWYDAEKDDVRGITLAPPPPPAKPREIWFPDLSLLGWTAVVLAIGLVVGVAAAVILMLLQRLRERRSKPSTPKEQAVVDAPRVEQLSFPVPRDVTDFLAAAQRAYQEGNYRDAVIYLFSYQLLRLDEFHRIRLTKGKTNREYLRELKSRGDLQELLARTLYLFEDVFFGNHAIGRERFEGCWNTLGDFQKAVSRETTR